MPPDQRRAAIVAAAVGLLETHGPELTTRMVAEAAGVAEGTLFRVFPSLGDLLGATYVEYLSSDRLRAQLAAAAIGETLESATLGAVGALVGYFGSVHHALHPEPAAGTETRHQDIGRDEFAKRFADLHAWLTDTFTPHAAALTIPVEDYARFLKTLAIGHIVTRQAPGSVAAVADFALNGARRRPAPTATRTARDASGSPMKKRTTA